MSKLTREQQQFVCALLLLLLVGWAVKAWRMGQSPQPSGNTQVPETHVPDRH